MPALREIFASFGIQFEGTEKLNQVDNKVDGLISSFQKLGQALIGSAIVQGVRNFAHGVQEMGDEIVDTSARLGIATDDLQAFRYAAKLAADQGPEQLSASLQRLGLSIEAAGQGAKKQKKALKDLGVDAFDSEKNMRPFGELLPELADGFSKLTTASERNAAATALFGKAGVKLGVLLGQGREGLEAYREEFENFGGGFNERSLQAAAEYGDQIDRLDLALTSLKATVGSTLLPFLATLTERFAHGTAAAGALLEKTNLVKAAMGVAAAFTARFVLQLLSANKAFLVAAVGVAVLVAWVSDLMALFSTDSESVIGAFIDEIWGVGTAAELVAKTINSLTYAWESLKAQVTGDDSVVKKMEAARNADPVANAWFFDKITPEQRHELARGGRTPDSQAQDAAASAGDSGAFVANRDRRQTKEGAFQEFQERRLGLINAGQVQATDKDRATFGDKIRPTGQITPSPGVAGGAPSKIISIEPTNIVVQVPAGSTKEQTDFMTKQINAVIDQRNRKAAAALGEQG